MFLQLFLCVSIFFGFKPLLACEEKFTEVKVQLDTSCSLYYADPRFVNVCQAAGISCEFSTPFLALNCPLADFKGSFTSIDALPVTLFKDKKKNDVLCTLDRFVPLRGVEVRTPEGSDKKYKFILDSELDQSILQRQLDTFRTVPNYALPHEKTLLKLEVIERTSAGSKIIHGKNGYFKDEIQQKRGYSMIH